MKIDLHLCVGNTRPFEHNAYPPIEDCYVFHQVRDVAVCPPMGSHMEFIQHDSDRLAKVLDIVTPFEGDIQVWIAPVERDEITFEKVNNDLFDSHWIMK